jgi:hypothetical protein
VIHLELFACQVFLRRAEVQSDCSIDSSIFGNLQLKYRNGGRGADIAEESGWGGCGGCGLRARLRDQTGGREGQGPAFFWMLGALCAPPHLSGGVFGAWC